MSTGAFINFPLNYQVTLNDGGLTPDEQAVEILTKGRELLTAGFPGVAIIYSANEGQTRDLMKAYSAGIYTGNVGGANQAEVMAAMETRLGEPAWQDLQMKLRIAPITTIPDQPSNAFHIVKTDIARIRGQLEHGWAILGWQNQETVGQPDHPYAIGHGKANLAPDVDKAIQDGLKALAKAYPAPVPAVGR
ncbi:hypothetical protein [Rhizobium sp. BK251]|uniref:hypothetical protein n=1 Tax=Rhizobium sp. BK251 TaxID=2512125 RepID=UPI00104A9AE1|nr:hypothetical protein [Rhizobium sp. BK251]TCL62920.1 hypothetical protein EV286_11826 [Rhizobium sp. BK251]